MTLTRDAFLALPANQQESVARRMWANLHETYRGYNPLGGESNDVWMCALMDGDALQELDDGRFVIWDTGTKVVAVAGSHYNYDHYPEQQANLSYYPVAVRLTD